MSFSIRSGSVGTVDRHANAGGDELVGLLVEMILQREDAVTPGDGGELDQLRHDLLEVHRRRKDDLKADLEEVEEFPHGHG
jgi:hypothetical protein